MWRLRCGGRWLRLSRPRVLLLSGPTSYRTAAYLQAARELGVELLVAAPGKYSLSPEAAQGLHIELDDPDAAVQRIILEDRRATITGVISSDDATVELASHAAAALGLPHNPPQAARISRRKDLCRAALSAAGLPCPAYRRIDLRLPLLPQIASLTFPCVVKPLALSASRGVIRANDRDALVAALNRSGAIVAEQQQGDEGQYLLVESFIEGREVAVEGMLNAGQLSVLAIFDKPDPLDGPFFEETYYVTPSRHAPEIQEKLTEAVTSACTAFGLCEGPVHAELRVHDGQVWVLEVAARTIGGDCGRLLGFGAGESLERMVIRHAIGCHPSFEQVKTASGVLMIPIRQSGTLRRIEGILAARKIPLVEDVVILVREGYELVTLPEGGSYLGFVFARGQDPAAVEQALRLAYACLNVVVAPFWRLEAG